jgi:hypothetical protein
MIKYLISKIEPEGAFLDLREYVACFARVNTPKNEWPAFQT